MANSRLIYDEKQGFNIDHYNKSFIVQASDFFSSSEKRIFFVTFAKKHRKVPFFQDTVRYYFKTLLAEMFNRLTVILLKSYRSSTLKLSKSD